MGIRYRLLSLLPSDQNKYCNGWSKKIAVGV